MNWLKADFSKEGPGIPKDEPKKTGLALLAQILLREWWDLLKLNLLIVVFSLPIVTIPAAFAAAVHISVLVVEDENIYLRREFGQAFRAHFTKATLWGFGFASVLTIGAYAVFVYGQLVLHALAYTLPLALALVFSLYAWAVSAHLFVLMVRDPLLAPASLLRLAALSALNKPLPALGTFCFIALLWLVHITLYPASAIMPATFLFSLATLVLVFSVYGATNTALSFGREKPADSAGVFADAHKR